MEVGEARGEGGGLAVNCCAMSVIFGLSGRLFSLRAGFLRSVRVTIGQAARKQLIPNVKNKFAGRSGILAEWAAWSGG